MPTTSGQPAPRRIPFISATTGGTIFAPASTIDGAVGGETLTVAAGTGQVTFNGAVGSSKPLGNLLVTSTGATGVTFAQAVTLAPANSLTVTNGGAVLVQGTTVVPGGFSSTGSGLFQNTGSITTTGTALTVSHTGLVRIDAALSSGTGAVALDSTAGVAITAPGTITTTTGTVSIGQTLTGALTTAGNITSAGGAVRWYQNATLTGAISVTTGGGAFTASGTTTGANYLLTLNTGTAGLATFTGAVDNLPFTLVQSNGLAAASTWGATTPRAVTITDTQATKSVTFAGAQTNITTLTTSAGTGA